MERLKKTILQAVTTGKTNTGGVIIIPNLYAIYHLKFGLKQLAHDFGFFDAYVEYVSPIPPVPPVPPEITYYLTDNDGSIFTDYNNDKFTYQ